MIYYFPKIFSPKITHKRTEIEKINNKTPHVIVFYNNYKITTYTKIVRKCYIFKPNI